MTTVVAFTFKEAVRKRVALVGLLLTAAFLALYALVAHAFAVHGNVVTGLVGGAGLVLIGLYLASPLPVLVAIFVLAGSISADVESGLLHGVLARPLTRSRLVVGRYLGYAFLLVLYTVVLQAMVLLIAWVAAGARLPHAAEVIALSCLEPLTVGAVTLLGSTFLPTLAAGAAAVLLYGLSSVGGILGQFAALGGPSATALGQVGVATALLLPTDAIYRVATGLALQAAASPLLAQVLGPAATLITPSPALVVWSLAYVPAAVAAACWVMERRSL